MEACVAYKSAFTRIIFTMPAYKYDGPVECPASFDASNVRGKLAIVTGGKMSLAETFPSCLQMLISFIKAQMGLARHMSELCNLPGGLLVLAETSHRVAQADLFAAPR